MSALLSRILRILLQPSRQIPLSFASWSSLWRPGRGPAEILFRPSATRGMLVRVIASNKRRVFGRYHGHKRTISYLGQIDMRFGVPTTVRKSDPSSLKRPLS
jgi:hypothetical protein